MAVAWNSYILLRIWVRCCFVTKTPALCFHCGLWEKREKYNCSSFMSGQHKLNFSFGNVKLSLNGAFESVKNKLFR